MSGDAPDLPGDRLGRFLEELGSGPGTPGPANRIAVARIDSTNRLARRVVATYLADEVRPPEFLVFAIEQTAGRGRLGRGWTSPPGAGVYATRALPLPDTDDGDAGTDARGRALQSLPLLVGVGIARAIGRLLADGGSPSRSGLKWPNDVLIDGRKVAGILAESLAIGSGPPVALLGFGVNHARPRIGPELPDGATAISDHLAAPADRPTLGAFARALVAGVEAELAHLGDLPYAVAAFRGLSVHREGDVLRCRSGGDTIEGEFTGFDDRGHLRLLCDGGTVLLAAGEIVEDRTHDG